MPRIERFRDEALDLDREYPAFRGAVVVARRGPGACIPTPLHGPLRDAKPSLGAFYPFSAYIPRLGERLDDPNAPLLPILADLTGDDLGVAYIGHGYLKFVELAGRVADLGLDIAGVGRFGDLPRDRRSEASDRLLAFLAAFAVARPEGSTIRADLDPFADEGFGPVPIDRTAILDPRGEASGSPFVVLLRQGLFAALGELLAVAGAELVGATEAIKSDDDSSKTIPVFVTLDQAASMVHKSKRTLERYKTRGTLPNPSISGGGGRADLYDWPTMRVWLIKTFSVPLSEQFPADRHR